MTVPEDLQSIAQCFVVSDITAQLPSRAQENGSMSWKNPADLQHTTWSPLSTLCFVRSSSAPSFQYCDHAQILVQARCLG
jgi:hypothetical protein